MKQKLLLLAIFFLAIFLRFYDINWDQGQHLHPDERFLTMVGIDMKLPDSFAEYLNPQTATSNPANTGHKFYVYGTFPVVLNKFIAQNVNANNYSDFTILGRLLSGFADLFVILLIFKTGELFEKRYEFNSQVKYWSAFFYAITVLPIQLSHFFAVDTFLNVFVFAAFYSALRLSYTKNRTWVVLSGLFFGLAIGSKINAIFLLPLLLFFFVNTYAEHKKIAKRNLLRLVEDLVFFGLCAFIIGRVADPYLFQNNDFFDPTISKLFLDNLKQLQSWNNPQAWFPPGVQWIHKLPVIFALQNLILYGIGIGYTLCSTAGIFYIVKKVRSLELYIILSWVFFIFLYQSVQLSKTMRYFLILYPFLAICAGIGFTYLTKRWHIAAKGVLLLFILLWPLFFFSIYTKPHSRVSASHWIYATIPANSIILSEHWDDALPLSIYDMTDRNYAIKQLPVFGPDTSQKWKEMETLLAQGDYLILSSNRGWGSIPTVPERYPQMTKFYQDLFTGKTAYRKVAEFTSYPSLTYLSIPLTLPDDNAEEAFTVYDHPKVLIFQHIR